VVTLQKNASLRKEAQWSPARERGDRRRFDRRDHRLPFMQLTGLAVGL